MSCILDLGLPGLDGIEVYRQIRTFSDCYVIVVTARKDEVDTPSACPWARDDYVTKPFSVRELPSPASRPCCAAPGPAHERIRDPSSEAIRVFGIPVLTPTVIASTWPTPRWPSLDGTGPPHHAGSTTHDGLHPSPAHR